MEHKVIAPLLIIALFSMFLLGKGITGFVVSESCCFPPDCKMENMCNASGDSFFYDNHAKDHFYMLYLGLILSVFSIVIYFVLHEGEKPQ